MTGELERLTIIVIIALVYAPLEILSPAANRPRLSWRRYSTDLLHVVVGGAIIRAGTAIAIAVCLLWISLPPIGKDLPLWAQLICIILLSDFAFYLAHRLYHASPLLWRFHKIHHSSEHLDWLAAYRVHPVDQIGNAAIIALPALAFGFSPVAIVIYSFVYQWHSILLHSNIKASFGPFAAIVASPRFHRWHHANDPRAFDKNFGGQLTVWDRLFGTAYEPGTEPERYGVQNAPAENFVAHMISPFLPRQASEEPRPVR